MDNNDDDFNFDEDASETQLPSHGSTYTNSTSRSSTDSTKFTHSLSDSISEEMKTKQLADYVHELKAELQTRCHLDWLSKFEPSEHNPKVELNLLLHGAIRERTLKQLAHSKNLHFNNNEQFITHIFQNDHCLLQRIVRDIVHEQRQQRIIYTELLFRPDVFNFEYKNSQTKLKDILEVIIDCIRFFTASNTINDETDLSNEIKTTAMKPFIPYGITPLPIHIKIILSCNWNNVESMTQFIRLTRDYPNDIVGIDFYGEEDDCRKYWHDFGKYTNILRHYHIPFQASMTNYKDLQLIDEVIQGLCLERVCEAYEIVYSPNHLENILIKHAVHLVVCPLSDVYITTNHSVRNIPLGIGKKRKYPSTNSFDNLNNDNHEIPSYSLLNYLQTEFINYSITSLSPVQYKQNLSCIYKQLFEKNPNVFTCEHMQWLNENALRASFASQKLKTELINYLREHYRNCSQQTTLLKQFQETTMKWQEEMTEIIDKNAQTAVDFVRKMRKDKILQRLNDRDDRQTKISEEANEDKQLE